MSDDQLELFIAESKLKTQQSKIKELERNTKRLQEIVIARDARILELEMMLVNVSSWDASAADDGDDGDDGSGVSGVLQRDDGDGERGSMRRDYMVQTPTSTTISSASTVSPPSPTLAPLYTNPPPPLTTTTATAAPRLLQIKFLKANLQEMHPWYTDQTRPSWFFFPGGFLIPLPSPTGTLDADTKYNYKNLVTSLYNALEGFGENFRNHPRFRTVRFFLPDGGPMVAGDEALELVLAGTVRVLEAKFNEAV